jgi:excinuclease UvrABC helicase subunit UvrB
MFPQARIGRLDRDTVRGREDFERALNALNEGELDMLVGTQMIAKGHDVHGVTLVGVVGADTALGLADFRAAERTFQLLTQVAGRAGRGNSPGQSDAANLFSRSLRGAVCRAPRFRRLLRQRAYSSAAGCTIRPTARSRM